MALENIVENDTLLYVPADLIMYVPKPDIGAPDTIFS